VERALPAYPFRTPRLVFRNLGDGRFEELIDEAGSGVASAHSSRGCAFGDFDNDGDVDVLVMNMNEPPSLLRNDVSGGGHWLKVLLVGVTSNRSAIGLGTATSADLTIRWPNGSTEKVGGIDRDQLVVIREGSGVLRRQKFG
jgi:hypothetical protein